MSNPPMATYECSSGYAFDKVSTNTSVSWTEQIQEEIWQIVKHAKAWERWNVLIA